jgi:sugar (pentulose or hexulose) kinase
MPHRLNSLYQLYGICKQKPEVMKAAKRFLNTPDLLNYFLTGKAQNELTIFSTTQCLDVPNKRPAGQMLEKLGIDTSIFSVPVRSGVVLGRLRPGLAAELGIDTTVVTVAGHDTASAIGAVHWMDNFLFISSGTFSVVGVEIDKPYLTDSVFEREFTQEANAAGQIQLKRNVTGLWMLQECRRVWKNEDRSYSYGELSEMSENASGDWIVDTTEPRFAAVCDMPKVIQQACIERYGTAPSTYGEICRTIDRSLAETYGKLIGQLEEITGTKHEKIYMVGGGIRNRQLCHFTAERTGREIVAGPIEAAALGNLSMQMVAMGLTENLTRASVVVSNLEKPVLYPPPR